MYDVQFTPAGLNLLVGEFWIVQLGPIRISAENKVFPKISVETVGLSLVIIANQRPMSGAKETVPPNTFSEFCNMQQARLL